MSNLHSVKLALLDLGLEDAIPLPEAVTQPEVTAVIGDNDHVETASRALEELLDERRIQVLKGPWWGDERSVDVEHAKLLLQDPENYTYDSELDGRERVYYINVMNIRSDFET